MGARGPIPEREANLARPRERKGSDEQSAKRGQLRDIQIDWQPDPEWQELTKQMWEAGKVSGMSDFYQDSDYAQMWFMCQEMDRYTKPRVNQKTGELYYKQSPEMVKAIVTMMNNLGFDEGSRRRVRIELDPPQEQKKDAQVLAFELYSNALEQSAQTDSEEEPTTE